MTSAARRHNWALKCRSYGAVTEEIVADVCEALVDRGATPWPDEDDHAERIERARETGDRCSLGFVREGAWSYPVRVRWNEHDGWLSLVAGISGTYALPFCSFVSLATDAVRAAPLGFGAIRPEFEQSLPAAVTDELIAEAGPAVWFDGRTARRAGREWFDDGPAFATRRYGDGTAVALLSPDPTDGTDRRYRDWFGRLDRVRATLAEAVGVDSGRRPLDDPDYRSVRLPAAEPDAALADDPVGLLDYLGTWDRRRAEKDLERTVSERLATPDADRADAVERLRRLAEGDERHHVREEAQWALSEVL